MNEVKKNHIYMPRGDTFITTVTIKRKGSGDIYVPVEGDAIRFALKHAKKTPDGSAFTDRDPLILKDIPYDTLILKLDPEDTKSLGFGEYVYDVQITRTDGTVETFIEEAPFTLKPEVD